MVQIVAHRGSSGNRPENTLPAFAEAVRVKADIIELDVNRSEER
ncbi:MAG TPA: glycerophosphodiester phosphodiesterase, partial [Enterococcus sp.]|nr:glycerophosphodiester phosphodiesterase [Enterococcus sp.]